MIKVELHITQIPQNQLIQTRILFTTLNKYYIRKAEKKNSNWNFSQCIDLHQHRETRLPMHSKPILPTQSFVLQRCWNFDFPRYLLSHSVSQFATVEIWVQLTLIRGISAHAPPAKPNPQEKQENASNSHYCDWRTICDLHFLWKSS